MSNDFQDITQNIKKVTINLPFPGYDNFICSYIIVGKKNALIDVGPSVGIASLTSTLAKLRIPLDTIDYIILTHIHMDHAGGIGTALKIMPNAKIVAHAFARPHLIDPSKLWKASLKVEGDLPLKYGMIESVPEDHIISATEGMMINLGDDNLWETYLTPGHAPHHICIFNRTSGMLMAGDAAGMFSHKSRRIVMPPTATFRELISSIDKLIALKPKIICFSHVGCYDNAIEHLERIKHKTIDWYETVNSAVHENKIFTDILTILRQKDRDLDFLNNLDKDSYKRELDMFKMTVRTMMSEVTGVRLL